MLLCVHKKISVFCIGIMRLNLPHKSRLGMLAGYEKDGKIALNSASSAMQNSTAIPQRVAQIEMGKGIYTGLCR